ncbi:MULTISPECIES: LysR family transcriptional regulator [unclassified Vibrio]|uniref:LysR family transcriptional regulator n=1 Tax=Vibrio sp. HB236076 TaxID=3232307 RepID=A0AB39HIZ6_9VIBR|nr:LysR family transcriptional regulator [Vibrio sp. HB161653]MDP5254111.1 LysR family transcriptional regulator [Vibrio sp. HB161653]
MSPYPDLPFSHNSLKSFESVARHLSFTQAAAELHVTQSAVSRQVKQLESELGVALVIRKHRAIELTAHGQALFATLSQHYQALETLIASWQHQEHQKVVIKATLSYATRCLIPKFKRLSESFPNVDISVVPALEEDEGVHRGDYDLFVFNTRKGHQYQAHSAFTYLRDEFMSPVCPPNLLGEQQDLEQVLSLPRLHPTFNHEDWNSWLKKNQIPRNDKVKNSVFFTLDLALSACLAGQGVTVTDLMLVLPEMKQGFLTCPSQVPVQHSAWQYYCHQRQPSSLHQSIIEWLQQESHREVEQLYQLARERHWQGLFTFRS